VALERARMDHMSTGFESNYGGVLHSLAYVSFQELATRISHRNTGKATGDPIADRLLARIALDENLHMIFYRNLLNAALELAPDQTMRAVTDVVTSFQMPGHDLAGFQRKAIEIALAGIYDARQHRDDVLLPVLRHWKIWELAGLGAAGEQAREELGGFLDSLDRQASRFEERRDALKARLLNQSG
jgi:acyl-[acyl-carrier-protein] desaturase